METLGEKRLPRSSGRLWLGAPALMVLVCGLAQAAPEDAGSARARGPSELTSAVRGSVACFATATGLAQRVAYALRALDRMAALPAAPVARQEGLPAVLREPLAQLPGPLAARLDPAASCHQTAAP
jgi:hypothetical protein